MTQKAIIVAPGRGTYNKEELGYFARHHGEKIDFINMVDSYRHKARQELVSELDEAESFDADIVMRGDNASPLIYACAHGDFQDINRDKFDLVGVTGNSMGWYIALACGGALTDSQGLDVINTMGTYMQDALIGGQVITTYVDENWQIIDGEKGKLLQLCDEIEGLYPSIYLGGMFLFGGTEQALSEVMKRLEKRSPFPFRLPYHAAFHTSLQNPISDKALQHFDRAMFNAPQIPLIDGRGQMHQGNEALFDYTFGHQVTQAYDFTRSIQACVEQFAPDVFILLGPGSTLGGAVAQSLIEIKWKGLTSKTDFINRQKSDPVLLSMGMDDQRNLVM